MTDPHRKKRKKKRNRKKKSREVKLGDDDGVVMKRQRLEQDETPTAAESSVSIGVARSSHPAPASSSSLSLASRLKRQRGTAESTPLPPPWSQQPQYASKLSGRAFLTPKDGEAFESCRQECYRGFHWELPESLPEKFHKDFDSALDTLDRAGLFLYDAVQPGKKRLSRTMVTRTLIGEPGTTYRYLGLRLFAHPWSRDDDSVEDGESNDEDAKTSLAKLGYTPECAEALLRMGELNQILVRRTNAVLQQEIAPHVQNSLVGSAEYTLTLVNKMEPTSLKKDLKPEKLYNMGKASVSWHKDSGLMDFSSIAVYHSLRNVSDTNSTTSTDNIPWRVAMRVASKDTSTPPLSVPLPSGSVYYLLDDFNHKHEHTVLAGSSQLRYSSTHRVERKGRGTWQYIRNKCKELLENDDTKRDDRQRLSLKRSIRVKRTRAQQQLLTEIEFEWLRQWYIQGSEHASLHPYWHKPMNLLERWFEQLQKLTEETLETLKTASKVDNSTQSVSDALFDVMIEAFEERAQLHESWSQREKDPVFGTMPQQCRPLSSNPLDKWSRQDAHASIQDIRKWRKAFVERHRGDKSASKSHLNLTKKEKKKVASNWEMLKASMKSKK